MHEGNHFLLHQCSNGRIRHATHAVAYGRHNQTRSSAKTSSEERDQKIFYRLVIVGSKTGAHITINKLTSNRQKMAAEKPSRSTSYQEKIRNEYHSNLALIKKEKYWVAQKKTITPFILEFFKTIKAMVIIFGTHHDRDI